MDELKPHRDADALHARRSGSDAPDHRSDGGPEEAQLKFSGGEPSGERLHPLVPGEIRLDDRKIEETGLPRASQSDDPPDPARQHHPLLDGIRKSINDCFGGMGPGSSIWGSTQYDKGFCAGVLAALTAFDTERKKGEL